MAEDRQILRRIVALLLALAGLAERAGAAPLPVLCLVLAFLRPAEGAARRFVADLSPSVPVLDDPATPAPDARAEVLRLAQALRMLALLLDGLAAAGAPLCGFSGPLRRAALAILAAIENLAWQRPQAADTS